LDTKGFILYNLGKYEEAIYYFDKAISIYPEYAEVWNHKGSALQKLGKGEDAKECFNKAKSLGLNAV
jgi:tetratricopeptide (TPR) repeat protein